MTRSGWWVSGIVVISISAWIAFGAPFPPVVVPFAAAPQLVRGTSVDTLFARKTSGSYVSAGFAFTGGYPLITGMSALTELLSGGLASLFAGAQGPPGVGIASQMTALGKFTSAGGFGIAYTVPQTNSINNNYVYVANWSPGIAYGGTVSYQVGLLCTGVIAADFNGDGVADLAAPFVGNHGSPAGGVAVLINNGDGTFKAPVIYTAGVAPFSIAALDLNHDGILDLAVADNGSSSIYVLLGNANGTFGTPAPYAASASGLAITIADMNGDGNPDIAEIGEDGQLSILLNAGNGTFRSGPSFTVADTSSPSYLAAGDFNGDGLNDLALADEGWGTVTVFLNTGGGVFEKGSTYAVSIMPTSLVITDYNHDGKLDILNAVGDARGFGPSPYSGNIELLLGNGDGTFQGETITPGNGGQGSEFLAVADFNGDGIPDAVENGLNQTLLLFDGAKTGVFRQPTSISTGQLNPVGAVAGDFNGDGKPDLAITDSSGMVGVLLNTGSGFAQPSAFPSGGSGTKGIAAADFNHDGKLDLAVTNEMSGTTAVFFGAGDGSFQLASTYPTGSAPSQVLAADVNGDGKPDLIVVDSGQFFSAKGGVYVLLNNGAGGFAAPILYNAGVNPITASIGDINGDGKPDLIVGTNDSNFDGALAIFLNNGSGGFGTATLVATECDPSSIVIHDFNGDGKADLAIAHCCGQTNMTYRQGNGNGTFSIDVDFNAGENPTEVQVVDFAGNGAPDLAVSLENGGMVGLLNIIQPGPGALTSVSAAASLGFLAPGSLATSYGSGLARSQASAQSTPLPVSLNGTTVAIKDSAGNTTAAPLVFVSASQVNYLIPSSVAIGPALVTVTASNAAQSSGQVEITSLAPALFTLNQANLAAANAICVSAGGSQTVENVYQVTNGAIVAAPLNLKACVETVLQLFGTGMDALSAGEVQVTLAGLPGSVTYAGPQGSFVGLDQINVVIPSSLAASGSIPIVLTAEGQTANTVNVTVK
jgi:uncharacterized protein (TIGR03437 family)